jgi:hypothetical protein
LWKLHNHPPLLHIPAIDEKLFEAGVDFRQPFPVSSGLMRLSKVSPMVVGAKSPAASSD